MTRPSKNALVLDGEDIKARLLAERVESRSVVHVDWVRFTTYLRNADTPAVDLLFPTADVSVWDDDYRKAQLNRVLASLPDGDFSPAAQAYELAGKVCAALGDDFTVALEVRKGHDFYKSRWSIERNGFECGWVGFLTSGKNPKQAAQARTLHVNLYGAGCTFAAHGWTDRLAALIEEVKGDITRCDLALDFFDGFEGGLDQVTEDYRAGLCNVGGRQLTCNMVGDWMNGRARSFYMGSKEAGKQTNVYEKGHMLFGADSDSKWVRVELRYGNKLRVLSPDMLRRPADFFAGASDWHALMLTRADAIPSPQPIKTMSRLELETVQAEVNRSIRWAMEVAGPTIAAAFRYFGDGFLALCENKKLPARLARFSHDELIRAFSTAESRVQSCIDQGEPFFLSDRDISHHLYFKPSNAGPAFV